MGRVPAGTETVVGISHSGTSGATVKALRIARESGRRVVAITSNPESPLADEADELQLVPTLALTEAIPCGGHLMLGLGVAAVCGEDISGLSGSLARLAADQDLVIRATIDALPVDAPHGVSVLTLPDLRGAGDFWMLKLIEATGVPVRAVALEESGHADYFIGPQPHLAIHLLGGYGQERHNRLARALQSTGQTVQPVQLTGYPECPSTRETIMFELIGAIVGALVAAGAAERWHRAPFRGGAVNMDARHIKLNESATVA
jgi:hypothetical protein